MTPEQFWSILHNAPEPKPVFWRLYYNSQGEPLCYSMEDLPGNYIDVDAETFAAASYNVRVVNGKLKHFSTAVATKLAPGSQGTQCHPKNVAVVVNSNGTRWSKQNNGYEAN